MRILFENWRKYITEVSQQEQSYFGNTIKIADQIIDELDKWKSGLQDRSHNFIKQNMQQFADLLKQKIPNLTFIGAGQFRAVFSTDKDIIIKVDYTDGSVAKEQNESDASIGRLGDDPVFSHLFPKSYLSHKDSRWVILEKVKPLNKEEYDKFNQFFNTSEIQKFTNNTKLIGYYIRACLVYDVAYSYYKQEDLNIQQAISNELRKLMPVINSLKSTEKIYQTPPVRQLVPSLQKGKLFVDLVRACYKYKIDPSEIRPDNVGITEDNRFVILDSSKIEEINKSIDALTINAPVSNEVTAPLKK